MGFDRDENGKVTIKYQYSHVLKFHKLLTKKRISKSFLSLILEVSSFKTAISLINKPLRLNLQQLINLSFFCDVDLYSLIDCIRYDIINCATSFNPELLDFVPPHLRELKKSADWINR